jgi:NADPH:quinone reductase-like Zn-dependent oxidoreductase
MIRAVVVDPQAPGRLNLADVEEPRPLPSEAVVRVAAISLNRGEVYLALSAEAGWRPGWDLAGTVERAAADGSGPAAGARVVGYRGYGAWAEVVAVPTNALAILPDDVSFAQAATLPIAGLTALYALERGGMLLERPVLITGVTGGVGYYACQLAHETGARVTAVVRRQDQIDLVKGAGADTVVVSEDAAAAAAHGPYHLIMDSVGGRTLANAITMPASDGTCVTLGASEGAVVETSIQPLSFLRIGGARLYGLGMYYELQRQPPAGGLARLVRLVAAGRLRPLIAVEEPWTEIGRVAQQLRDRRYAGKAVLHITA